MYLIKCLKNFSEKNRLYWNKNFVLQLRFSISIAETPMWDNQAFHETMYLAFQADPIFIGTHRTKCTITILPLFLSVVFENGVLLILPRKQTVQFRSAMLFRKLKLCTSPSCLYITRSLTIKCCRRRCHLSRSWDEFDEFFSSPDVTQHDCFSCRVQDTISPGRLLSSHLTVIIGNLCDWHKIT